MIKLDFLIPNNIDWDNWVADCHNATITLIQSYQNGHRNAITNLYRGQLRRFHIHPFYGKCAYCESKVEINSPDYVEHFRPKGGVRDANNTIVTITNKGIQIAHPGYYWLAYTWANLLPTCWKCNTWHEDNGVQIGKGNRFPISGNYAIDPGDEVNEVEELINPMFEDPENHITIDKLGFLHALPGSKKGQTCITFFGLNTREPLVNGRKKEYDNIINKLRLIYTISDPRQLSKEIDEISSVAKGKDEYTIAARRAISDITTKVDDIQNQVRL
jgi:hypothetical protein